MDHRVSAQPLIEAVDRLAGENFNRLGLRRREEGIYTIELTPDFLGWVGLNRAVGRGKGWLEINQVVGVRCQPLERKVAEFQGQKWHPYVPPTISTHIGYLMPERAYIPSMFSVGVDPGEGVRKMATALEQYGIPFMKSSATLDSLAERMSTFAFTTADSRSYRLPILYLLSGDRERAHDEIRKSLAALEGQTHGGATFFRNFAQKVIEPGAI